MAVPRTVVAVAVVAGVSALALGLISLAPLVVPDAAEPPPTAVPSAESSPESGPWPRLHPDRLDDEAYLDGHEYLRGVNVYSLIFEGRQEDLSLLGESQASYDFLASRGLSFVRLAVPWQRLQEIPAGGSAADGLAQPISDAYLDVIETQVERAAAAGMRTVIDLHNGCTYPWGAGNFVEGSVRCGDGIEQSHVEAIWSALAGRFRNDERVLAFDIFNEPRWSVGVDQYKLFAQYAVDAIRSTGDAHVIWVEGILSDTRGRLAAIAPDGPWIEDPLARIMYSEHFYATESGAVFDATVDNSTPLQRLHTFGQWCRRWEVRCSIGEVGWPSGGHGGVQTAESGDGWNALFEEFYDVADDYGLDVAYFAASSSTKTGTLLAYVSSRPGAGSSRGIDTALSQSEIIEAHLSEPESR